MSIKDFLQNLKNPNAKKEATKYVGSFTRSFAAAIDALIVLFIRFFVLQILSKLWIEREVVNFQNIFSQHFGTETVKRTPEHIEFFIHSSVFLCLIISLAIVLLVGAFYHAYLNSSAWKATIGKRLTKIIIVKQDFSKLNFGTAFGHYFLSILPFAFVIYLTIYKANNQVSFFHAVTATEFNIFLGILFVGWVQIQLFTKRKTTAYDLICGTVLAGGKTEAKLPWSKIKN